VFHISILEAWSFVWGDKPTKAPPWQRDWFELRYMLDYFLLLHIFQ